MPRSIRWTLAGTLAGALPVLVACSTNSPQAPQTPPRPLEATQQTYQARDFYFPASATMRAVYSFSESAQLPAPLQSFEATGSLTVEVLSYSPNQAVIQTTTVATGENGQPTTEVSTSSVTVEADGTVVAGDGASLRHSNAVFTSAGTTVAPASGSEIPEIRARMVGTEAVTVPAGTYQTVHIQEGPAAANAPQADLWLASGVGIVRQRIEGTFPVQTGQNQTGQGRSTYEMRLESFTP